ncbi:menaquinone-dependent protoporphyrinogen IX dehydrogenase [Pseudovibrio brasiliensis]|uniref:Protoporphyrinogen IX dehydrogenase [quinone] n=2 Tax=Pseudovibrio brasiliensis TaxID=1898042 RepID=A0ABX8AL41_9HYPH|nr:menaquinone-dependent protoporphyrinogen IX dehydrogenase [Pseudovibrio brasiliensis]
MQLMKHYLAYASHDGQTRKIIGKISEILELKGEKVVFLPLATGMEPLPSDLQDASILIGAPIRYGFHLKPIRQFVQQNLNELNAAHAAFFSVNLTARKAEKSTPETNAYIRKFLEKSKFQPKQAAVFAGALNYPNYKPWDRLMIQLIMKMTNGPTDPSLSIEFTDWRAVERFAVELASPREARAL